MNITSKGRYALRIMLDLAQHGNQDFVSLKTVAERQKISMKYLEMIVARLKKAGLVDSSRGKEGGYRLSAAPESTSVLRILSCIEDNLAPVSCIQSGAINCSHADACLTIPMWMELDEITNGYLASVSLQDLLSGERWREASREDRGAESTDDGSEQRESV